MKFIKNGVNDSRCTSIILTTVFTVISHKTQWTSKTFLKQRLKFLFQIFLLCAYILHKLKKYTKWTEVRLLFERVWWIRWNCLTATYFLNLESTNTSSYFHSFLHLQILNDFLWLYNHIPEIKAITFTFHCILSGILWNFCNNTFLYPHQSGCFALHPLLTNGKFSVSHPDVNKTIIRYYFVSHLHFIIYLTKMKVKLKLFW